MYPPWMLGQYAASRPFFGCVAQLIRNLLKLPGSPLESFSHAREILSRGRSSPDRPTAKYIVLQAGIIGELPHGKGPVAKHALNKPDDVFAPQLSLPFT